jgi:HEAT repeat protein
LNASSHNGQPCEGRTAGPERIAALVAALESHPEEAGPVCQSLLAIGGEPVARSLVPLLSHNDTRVSSLTMAILVRLGDCVGPVLVELLRHPDRELRKMAAELLAQGGYCPSPEVLAEAMADPDPLVRAAVASAMSHLACPGTAALMLERLPGENVPWVRFAMVEAVVRLGSPDDIAKLLQLVSQDEMLRDFIHGELNQKVNRQSARREET